jgi:hypothetical protein
LSLEEKIGREDESGFLVYIYIKDRGVKTEESHNVNKSRVE